MIKFSFKKLPVDEDGKAYDNLEAFQESAIQKLVDSNSPANRAESALIEVLVEHKAEVIEILQLTMDARPTARGQKRPRKSKPSTTLMGGSKLTDAA